MDRIKLIASLCKGSVCVCDVGCDHAYALITAIKEYGVLKGIASEIQTGPLENAIKSIKANGLEDKIKTCLSDGFSKIEDDFDTAIIAGMGGALITQILVDGYEKIKNKKLILEANCESYRIREFLFKHGFKIDYEESLFDQGKYYEVIVSTPGDMNYDEYDIKYGPLLRKQQNLAFKTYYNNKIQLLETVLDKIKDNDKKAEKDIEKRELESILKYPNVNKYYISNTINYYRTYFIDDFPRPTIIITPGGGYKYTSPRESEPVVLEFNKRGYHCVVVNYRETIHDKYPLTGKYIVNVINKLREDNKVSKLIGMGFSAGAHAILEVNLHHNDYGIEKLDSLILGYPVITADRRYAHLGSFIELLKEEVDNEQLRDYVSLEKQINSDNIVDLFLWGTFDDNAVPVKNSLLLVDSYLKNNGSVEYHLYPCGHHGLSVCNEYSAEGDFNKINPNIAKWVDLADYWLKNKRNED